MTLPLLEIPDDPQTWPPWLERQLVGFELAELVEQLSLVLGEASTGSTPEPPLDEICGPQWTAVLESGLGALTAEQIRLLLKHPQRLLELQERVLLEGQRYWTALLDTSTARTQTDAPVATPGHPTDGPASHHGSCCRSLQFAISVAGSLLGSLAAAVLIGVGIWWSQPGHETGWNRPGVFTAQLPPGDFSVSSRASLKSHSSSP